jgi:hypothetical protein
MAHSIRRTPIVGMTTAEMDKPFKAMEHRRERRAVESTGGRSPISSRGATADRCEPQSAGEGRWGRS